MSKTSLGPCVTFFPQPITLVSSLDSSGSLDLMAASWVGVVSKTPPTLALALHHDRQTYAQIRETGEFVVNLVPASLAAEADYCGLRSGRQQDKAAVTGLATQPASQVKAPLLADCPLNVECVVRQEVPIGDYRLLLGEILEIHADSATLVDGKLSAAAFDPLVYLGGIREYWSLGEKVAPAYNVGTTLFEREA